MSRLGPLWEAEVEEGKVGTDEMPEVHSPLGLIGR